MTIGTLLSRLPPYRHNVQYIVRGEQNTRDLMREVVAAHEEFARDYDRIADKFEGGGPQKIARRLFDFCKDKLRYEAETKDDQTSRSPGCILSKASAGATCDCKHYAGFIGGVLDAINRRGQRINWRYRYASYDDQDKTPEHVFVVMDEAGREIWIDPTPLELIAGVYMPRAFDDRLLIPEYYRDKIVNTENMSLSRLSGVSRQLGMVLLQPFQTMTYGQPGLVLEESSSPVADYVNTPVEYTPAPEPVYQEPAQPVPLIINTPAPVITDPVYVPTVVAVVPVSPGNAIAVGEPAPVISPAPTPDKAPGGSWWWIIAAIGGIYLISKTSKR